MRGIFSFVKQQQGKSSFRTSSKGNNTPKLYKNLSRILSKSVPIQVRQDFPDWTIASRMDYLLGAIFKESLESATGPECNYETVDGY